MVSFLKKYLATTDEQTKSEISAADHDERIKIAVCAMMIEIASIDDDFSDEEREIIIKLLKKRFELNDAEADELIEISHEEVKKAIDLYGFAKTIKNVLDKPERAEVIEEIWHIIYADGQLSGHEDSLVHKLSYIMGLSHKELIDAKLKALGRK